MKRLSNLQSTLEIFPSPLIYGQQSRPLDKERKQPKEKEKDMVDGMVLYTGLAQGLSIKIVCKRHGA
jgi:hypothetical protein